MADAGSSRQVTVPGVVEVVATQVSPPPGWALLERRLMALMEKAVRPMVDKYAEKGGAFYFAVQSVTMWMILKTTKTVGSASDILAMRRVDATERLMADPLVDPVDLPTLLEADLGVVDALQLQEIRRQQREDWIAFAVFFLLLGGADAFVTAHLADFPEPLETVIRPLPDMGVEFGFRLAF